MNTRDLIQMLLSLLAGFFWGAVWGTLFGFVWAGALSLALFSAFGRFAPNL